MTYSAEELDPFDDVSNPLDSVEEILLNQDWVFDRPTDDELTVQVRGKMGVYDMRFEWQDDFSAMQFTCLFDMTIPKSRLGEAALTASAMNTDLWLGHFDIRPHNARPAFRHTTLFRGVTGASGAEHIEDLMDIALAECERYYAAFDLLSREAETTPHESLSLALLDTQGQA